MDPTETPTATETPTPTITLTPTATYTATPNIYIEATTEAGEPARIAREVSVGDYTVILLLWAILLSLWVMFIITRLSQRKGDK